MDEQEKPKREMPPEYWWVIYFREDIQEIRADIKRLDDRVNSRIDSLRKEFKEDIEKLDDKIDKTNDRIDSLRKEFKEDIEKLRKEIAELRSSLITWLFAGVGFLAALMAVLKFVG